MLRSAKRDGQNRKQKRSNVAKAKKLEERITRIEDVLMNAHKYLESGANADWHRFRPLFKKKIAADGRDAPPHKDWVKNVFIVRYELALHSAKKALTTLLDRSK